MMWLLLAVTALIFVGYINASTIGTFEMSVPTGENIKTIGAILGGVAAIGTLLLAMVGKLGASFTWLLSVRTRRVSLDERLIKLREEQIEKLLDDVKRLQTASEADAKERAALRTEHSNLRKEVKELQAARIVDIDANKLALERLANEKDLAHAAQLNSTRLEHEKTLTAVRTQFAARIEDLEEHNVKLRKENDELRAELLRHHPSERPVTRVVNETGSIC